MTNSFQGAQGVKRDPRKTPVVGDYAVAPRGESRGVLGSNFTGYGVAPQNPYPIIGYFWSILWPNIDPILVTFGYYSMFRVFFVANCKHHLSHFWANDVITLKVQKKSDPILV